MAGVPPCAGLPPLLILVNGGAFYVCCCLSCVWLRSRLVAGLPVWWCLWLVSCPACPVSLAVCSGGGVCLSAGGGFCPRHLLACWCFCWSAGCCPLRVVPRSGCSVAADPGRFGPDRRQLHPKKPPKRKNPSPVISNPERDFLYQHQRCRPRNSTPEVIGETMKAKPDTQERPRWAASCADHPCGCGRRSLSTRWTSLPCR